MATRNARSIAARSPVEPESSLLPISATETPSCAASAATTSSASRASQASGVSAAARESAAAAARARGSDDASPPPPPPPPPSPSKRSRTRFPARRARSAPVSAAAPLSVRSRSSRRRAASTARRLRWRSASVVVPTMRSCLCSYSTPSASPGRESASAAPVAPPSLATFLAPSAPRRSSLVARGSAGRSRAFSTRYRGGPAGAPSCSFPSPSPSPARRSRSTSSFMRTCFPRATSAKTLATPKSSPFCSLSPCTPSK